jgi:hypothetical protein
MRLISCYFGCLNKLTNELDDIADDGMLAGLDIETVLWVALHCTVRPLVY